MAKSKGNKKDSSFSTEKKGTGFSTDKKDSSFSTEKKGTGFSTDKKDSSFSAEKKGSGFSTDKKDSSFSTDNDSSEISVNIKSTSTPTPKKEDNKKVTSDKVTTDKSKITSEEPKTKKETIDGAGGKKKSKLVLLVAVAAVLAAILYQFDLFPSQDSLKTDQVVLNEKDEVISDIDTDEDGMPDTFEKNNGLNPDDPSDALLDEDNDGLSNLSEMMLGTNITNSDSDGDGQSDGAELSSDSDPSNASSTYVDSDGDGLSDSFEESNGLDSADPTDALLDNDGDGKSNFIEMISGTDISKADETDDIVNTNNNSEEVAELSQVKESIREKEVEPKDEITANKSSIDSDIATQENMKLISPEKSTTSKVTLQSGDDIYYFESGSSFISKRDKQLLDLANELKSSKMNVKLVGHTDNTGSESINLKLSISRAKRVYKFLLDNGVPSSQIKFYGEGESSPKYTNDSKENKRRNRRVEIIF